MRGPAGSFDESGNNADQNRLVQARISIPEFRLWSFGPHQLKLPGPAKSLGISAAELYAIIHR